MNYIEQINVFWLLDEEHSFNGSETKLYFFLLKKSNSLFWKNPLTNADGHTAVTVGISVNTMKTARNRLQQAGLIKFKPGGNGKKDKTVYELIEAGKLFGRVAETDSSNGRRYQRLIPSRTPDPTPSLLPDAPPSINKDEKQNKTPGANAPDGSDAAAVEEKIGKGNSLFTDCVSAYDRFVRDRTDSGANIDGKEGKAMKNIIAYLTREVKKNPEADEADIHARVLTNWRGILENWHLLRDWGQNRLRLCDINSELVNILKQIKDGISKNRSADNSNTVGNQKPGQAGKTGGRGAGIAELQALKRNPATTYSD